MHGRVKTFTSAIDTVLVGNEYRKRYKFKSDYGHNFLVIAGIGNTKRFFYTIEYPYRDQYHVVYENLLKVYYKDKIIWTNPDYIWKLIVEEE